MRRPRAVGLGVAHGGGVDLALFVGNWQSGTGNTIVELGGQLVASCGPLALVEEQGIAFSVSAGANSDLALHVSCHCDLPLAADGLKASLVAPTACHVLLGTFQEKATVTELTLDLSTTPPRFTMVVLGEEVSPPLTPLSSAPAASASKACLTSNPRPLPCAARTTRPSASCPMQRTAMMTAGWTGSVTRP